ncbi:MAG: hypothetical protein CM15mP83_8990 [Flavobacteriaceae bacterium]|nr:MAG: hypothetical protein CM15mP83_8990 [Flavobacteriaceae bacterium]
MNHRQLVGGGYRHSLFNNDRQYIDLAAGLFYEDEEYPDLQTHKYRFNMNMFLRVKLLEKLYFNCVTYFKSTQKMQTISDFLLSQKSILNKTNLPYPLAHKTGIIQPHIHKKKERSLVPSCTNNQPI